MTEPLNQNLVVKLGDCNAGWISMLLTVGEHSLTVRMSHWLDPLPGICQNRSVHGVAHPGAECVPRSLRIGWCRRVWNLGRTGKNG